MSLLDYFRREESCQLLTEGGTELKRRFEIFRTILRSNKNALEQMAELEHLYYSGSPVGTPQILACAESLYETVHALTLNLNSLARDRFRTLEQQLETIMRKIRQQRERTISDAKPVYTLSELSREDAPAVGNKAANLGIMGQLPGLRIPDGFAISRTCFERFLTTSNLRAQLDKHLANWSNDDPANNAVLCETMQQLVLGTPIPEDISQEILRGYNELESRTKPSVRVALRSSAVGEDSTASFAGQYSTKLNVLSEDILDAYREVIASKYTPQAISYRLRYGLDDTDVPMCVVCIEMIDSRESGVLYTVEPDTPASGCMHLAAINGLGELLVSGQATPAIARVDKCSQRVTMLDSGQSSVLLSSSPTGGTQLVSVPDSLHPLHDERLLLELTNAGLRIEEHFGGPQDIEWATSPDGKLFILQARPLGISADPIEVESEALPNVSDFTILLQGGVQASRGIGHGPVHIPNPGSEMPQGAIMVARAASPDLAALVEHMAGIIAESGSAASHLASVARENGVPMIVGCSGATTILQPGQMVTLIAGASAVVAGAPEALTVLESRVRTRIFDTPVSLCFRKILDCVSPLNLTDPSSPNFSIQGCQTLHDIIRFVHEQVMRVMFGLAGTDDTPTIRLEFNIPLRIHFIDLGDGLRFGLTECQTLKPEDIYSIPMKAFWKGLAHPGISWSGSVGLSLGNVSSVIMGGMMTSAHNVGGDSYALVAHDYMNLSAKFGYHFANIDAICSDIPEQNHVAVQFSGGVGSFVGKNLRLNFLAAVMTKLGYQVKITGDQLDARAAGIDAEQMKEILDQTGRLLAASRLLDVGIAGHGMVDRLIESFFAEEYNFLEVTENNTLPGFYVPLGDWQILEDSARTVIVQDGSDWAGKIGVSATRFLSKITRRSYQDFLDGFEAYFHFPIAIAKQSHMSDGEARVQIRTISGHIDAAAGLAFGIQNIGNYFVWRFNALEHNAILFQFVNNKRLKRAEVSCPAMLGDWLELKIQVQDNKVSAYVGEIAGIDYTASSAIEGYLGLWTKADSKSFFYGLTANSGSEKKVYC